MTRNDGLRTTDAQPSPTAESEHRDLTRRSLLASGAAGIAATGLGVAGSTSAGAQSSEAGPAPPETLEVAWQTDERVGLTWEWPGDQCTNALAEFRVSVPSGGGSVEHAVDGARTAVSATVDLETEREVSVRAIDDSGRRSDVASASLDPVDAEPDYLLRSSAEVPLDGGESTTVPVRLERAAGTSADLVQAELRASVGAPCVATIESVTVPDDAGLSLAESSVADDGGAASFVVEPDVVELDLADPIALLEVVGHGSGETTLDVREDGLTFLGPEFGYADYQNYQTSPGAFPDRDLEDMIRSAEAVPSWTTVAVGTVETPPPPENFDIGWWINNTIGVVWEWPGDLCEDRLSHFLVREQFDDRTELHRVPAGQPAFVLEDTLDAPRTLEVRAVDPDGALSEPLTSRRLIGHADVLGRVSPEPPADSIAVGESIEVPIDFGDVDLAEYELTVSLSSTCSATITDVAVPNSDVELLSAEWAADEGVVTIHAQSPPGGESESDDLAVVEVTGHAVGGTVVEVADEDIYTWSDGATVEDDLEFPSEEFDAASRADTDSAGGLETWAPLRVVEQPPAVVGEARPRDVDSDGLYMDVTGDGSVGQSDVVEFFRHQHEPVVQDRARYYDFSGNGDVGHGDVVELFQHVATRS